MSQTRRLAAILAADVAGYSRLIGADEGGTLERLKALCRDRLSVVFEDLGEHQIKNIARPVRIYRVRPTLTHPVANAPGVQSD
jgi:class 3 adenylate cyclase